MTHPFHPLSGQAFVCVGERCNWYGVRVLLSVDDDTVYAVPQQWTDLVAPDPEVVMGNARALMHVADLVELAKLVDRLSRHATADAAEHVSGKLRRISKHNSAARSGGQVVRCR